MTLYHYTDAQGLKGILEKQALWATDHRFLNDSSEFQYGWKIVLEAVDRHKSQIEAASELAWNMIASYRENSQELRAYVGSLTTEGDLLSQWRGYNGGKGYSIGFSEDWVRVNAAVQGFQIVPVVYDENTQRDLADSYVRKFLDDLSRVSNEQARVFGEVEAAWIELVKVALRFKNAHFREECEHRFIWIGTGWRGKIETRVSSRGIIPYYICKMNIVKPEARSTSHPNNWAVEEIVVGPALSKHQESAVDALLASCKMRVLIRGSDIPYVGD